MSMTQALKVLEEDWKNFSFRLLTQDDVPSVEEHMKHNFFTCEPVAILSGVTEANAGDLKLDQLYYEMLSHNLSFGAFDKTNGKLVAVRGICRHRRGQDDLWAIANSSTEVKVTWKFVGSAAAGLDICEMYGVEEYAHLRVACVNKDYCNQGLATEMYRRTMIFLKEAGFSVLESVFTGPYSRAAARRFGFEELQRRYLRTMSDLGGNYLKLDATDEEYAAAMAKRI